MIDDATGAPPKSNAARIGAQPIALAGVALALLLIGGGSVALWRGYTGNLPETDRAVAARQIQMRTTEASEQLVEKTKALAVSQQDSIDQLQALQDAGHQTNARSAAKRQQTAIRPGWRVG
jgi:uncharacterized protein HemX